MKGRTTGRGLIILSLLALILAQGLAGAGIQESADDGVELRRVTDSLGREVAISGEPERIVIAGRAALITADALYLFPGMAQRVIAIGQTNQGLGDLFPILDPGLGGKRRLPHTVGAEEIAALNPDLVVVKDSVYSSLGEQLERIGLPVLALNLETPENYARDILIIGAALGNEERAEELVSLFRLREERVRRAVSPLSEEEKPRTLLLYYSARDGETAFNVSPDNWIQTYQVEKAGGRAVWKGTNTGSGWQKVNFEQIAAWNPDHIYLTAFNQAPADFLPKVLQSPQWRELEAYRNGNIKAIPADFHSWAQPDTRWILGLEWLAEDLHPSLFPAVDPMDKVRSFYTDFYQLDENRIEEMILPKVQESLSVR